MNKIKILVVDDHAILRDGIRALLNLHDAIEIVGEASEGKEAIEKAQELAPDVVVMDIAMAGMDGLEATRRITKKSPKVKVLVLTQHDNREYILSAIKAEGLLVMYPREHWVRNWYRPYVPYARGSLFCTRLQPQH